ncbi:putative acyl-CoA oxidase [Hypomontagnella monticulosa]|nr:putative acyl-CoA oxidase [Hypomontagnella monticulosa]
MASYDYVLKEDNWDTSHDHMDFPDPREIRRCHDRARTICQKAGISINDIVTMSPKFWDFNRHLIAVRDSAVTTILTIHWNLCMGTISKFAQHRQDLTRLLKDLESFNVCGEFLLTEVGHGLDALHLETTATLQSDGSFKLHTPKSAAAKVMPPTTPLAGVPRVGVVFARLLANDVDCGVKLFIVPLTNTKQMLPGITSRPLPRKSGSKALDHSVTTFNQVRLSPDSLLGSSNPPRNRRTDFLSQIWRVSVGTLSLSMVNIPALRQAAFIAGTYSLRRHVASNIPGQRVPIISFSTQYRPILNALAQAIVFDAFADDAIEMFLNPNHSSVVHQGVATCFKATVTAAAQVTLSELIDRCGWQGLFGYNQIVEIALSLRGNSIAEGDYTVLCIRLASEILLGRYELPPAEMKDCLLARHEAGVWQEARETMASIAKSGHRHKAYNSNVLPRSRALVQATGHRMAYEAAARKGNISPEILNLFESTCITSGDMSWYCGNGDATRQDLLARDVEAADALLPRLKELLSETGAAPWTTAPIASQEGWDEFIGRLPVYRYNDSSHERARL